MKTSGWWVMAAAVAGLALQGCASNGDLHYAPGAAPSATTHATGATAPVVTGINTKSDFEAVQAAINKQMEPGGRFSSVTPSGRAEINGRFQDMAGLFDRYGSVDKMGPTNLAQLTGDQNAINGVLAPHDGNRLICHDEMPVGSHLPKRVCRTLSEIQNQKTNANTLLRTMRNSGSYNTMYGGHGH